MPQCKGRWQQSGMGEYGPCAFCRRKIEEDMKPFTAKIQKKMLELETETLIINGSHLATWKIDSRGYKRFTFKELPEDKKIREVA